MMEPETDARELRARLQAMTVERDALNGIISDCAAAVGAGIAPGASLGFKQNLAAEISAVVAKLRAPDAGVLHGFITRSEALQLLEQEPGSLIALEPAALPATVFALSEQEGVLCCPGERFHGWLMRRHPDGQWVSFRKLEAVDPSDNPQSRALAGDAR